MLRDAPQWLTRSMGFSGTGSGAFMNVTADQVEAGQAVYTKSTLAAYDLFVLGVSNRCLWKSGESEANTDHSFLFSAYGSYSTR